MLLLLELYKTEKTKQLIENELDTYYGNRLVHSGTHKLLEYGLLDELEDHDIETWAGVYKRNEEGNIFLELCNNIYRSIPEPAPKSNEVLMVEFSENKDFLTSSKKNLSYTNKEPEQSKLVTYPYNNGSIAIELTKPLSEENFVTTRDAISSKNVFESINNQSIITHIPMPTIFPYHDKDIDKSIKRTVEANLSLSINNLHRKIAVYGSYASVTPSYVIHNQGVKIEDVKELYYTDGAIVDIILAKEFKKRNKHVQLIPIKLGDIFKEAKRILEDPESKSALIVKDTPLSLIKLDHPDVVVHHYIEFTNRRIDEAVILTRDFVKSNESYQVLKSIDKSRYTVAKKLGSYHGRMEIALSQIEQIPTLYKSYSKHIPSFNIISKIIKKIKSIQN